jgi:hypothetical protein
VAGVGLSALGTWYFDAWWMPEYAGAPAVFGSFSSGLCGFLVGAGTKVCFSPPPHSPSQILNGNRCRTAARPAICSAAYLSSACALPSHQ